MFKFDIRTIVLFLVVAVVSWTQWKIYSQEQTIGNLSSSLKTSQEEVQELNLQLTDLKEQVRIDRTTVADWLKQTSQLRHDQQGYQAEVKDVLTKFQYQLAIDAAQPEPPEPGYRIGDHITVPAIDGMWKSYHSTLGTTTRPTAPGISGTGTGGTPSPQGDVPRRNP